MAVVVAFRPRACVRWQQLRARAPLPHRAPQELESGASALAAAQLSFGTVQTQLAASSAAVAERQERLSLTLDGFTSTVKGLAAWQERSARGIGLLLGSRWGVDDVVWALASGGAAVWVTGADPLAGARLWLLAAICAGCAEGIAAHY